MPDGRQLERLHRLAQLADQARAVWAMLRQESNVDLGAFRQAGTSTHRKLELDKVCRESATYSSFTTLSE